MTLSRRTLLKTGLGAAGMAGLAGCSAAGGSGDPRGYGAFFTLWDWGNEVGGDEFPLENPIDVGEMGHGWEPEGDLLRNVAGTELFVYLDTPDFSWAQTAADQIRDDYDDVHVADVMSGLEGDLLPWDGGDDGDDSDRTPDRDHDWDPETVEVAEFDVIDRRTGDSSAYWHGGHWHGAVPDVPLDGSVVVEGVFEDPEGRVLPLGEDDPFQFGARFFSGATEDPVSLDTQGDRVEITGDALGRTQFVFELRHDGTVLWDTEADAISVSVVEELAGATEFVDPHVWVDPVLAGEMVENIADAIVEVDPDNEETYRENAAAYRERLDAVHESFSEMTASADRDVAILAGHDSFGYLEERYDFELYTPVGVSPEEEPSQNDIADAIEFVNEHDIDVVLYDHFESPNLAETIVENSQATETATVTPAEGTTSEWADEGYGWVEQMTEVTLPSFARALGAE
ncbi:zinc transport system substrate-binding protein [Halorubrum alkaliphilum]|uniref:Zinc transport system substrate-binding protein n=1 Tax=Halorubrum alkaliphilum TaxID=261290 RepID=A0A8T4GFV1_9EURY|nr:zinc ABC transporter substrate-binding protein [Halorubrum alkaliphilum]MBP1922062.1 zinc transport system substrate-binding protein [Halorubrum alkaliphilum]